MKCPSCSAEVTPESMFCPQCGQRLDADVPAPTKSVAEQVQAATAPSRAAKNDVETVLWKGGYSWKAMIGYWLLAALATIAALVIAVVVASTPAMAGSASVIGMVLGVLVLALWVGMVIFYLYQRLSVDYELTNQRLIHRCGILTRVTNRIETIDVDDVQFSQGLIERMLGVGTIRILSTDVSDPKLTLQGIDDVRRIFQLIDDARREERRKRGMYIETV